MAKQDDVTRLQWQQPNYYFGTYYMLHKWETNSTLLQMSKAVPYQSRKQGENLTMLISIRLEGLSFFFLRKAEAALTTFLLTWTVLNYSLPVIKSKEVPEA